MVAGSIGLLASASLGRRRARACTSRCTAPRPTSRARAVANPLATFGSVALMLRHSLAMEDAAAAVESAMDRVLERGLRTPDLASGHAEETAGGHRRDDPGGDRRAGRSRRGRVKGPVAMQQADFIWMNGELVRWEDAKVHVLTHALHYGSGVFEGIRAYETERGTAVFRHQDHLDRLQPLRRALLHGAAVHAREAARGDARADPGEQAAQLLHPPGRLPRLRRDGPLPAEPPGRRVHRGLAVGRLPRRGGPEARRPLQGLLLAADVRRELHPAGQGQRHST